MSRRGRKPARSPDDNLAGVVFYRVSFKELPWRECKDAIHDIAVHFAQDGPFRVRSGTKREEDGRHYWVGFNSPAVGKAFEAVVDCNFKRTTRLPGKSGNPKELPPVLDDEEFARCQLGAGASEPVTDDWSASAPPSVPESVSTKYRDYYYAVTFYLLDEENIRSTYVLEAIREIAFLLGQSAGSWQPFAVRYGIRPERSSTKYWVALNSKAAASMLEDALEQVSVPVTTRSRPRAGQAPPLRLAINLPGVPEYPPTGASAPAPEPDPIQDAVPDLDFESVHDSAQVRQQRRWARAIVAKTAAGLGKRLRRRPRVPKWARGRSARDET